MNTPVRCNVCDSLPIFVNEGDANHMTRLMYHSQAGAEAMGCPAKDIKFIVYGSDEEGVDIWNSIFIPPDRRA